MQPKDYITIIVSSFALFVALGTLILNQYQKRKDNLRAFRKELTDVIKEIVETNISIAKIENEAKELSRQVYDMRRNYNTRRRYLIDRAEFLIRDIPEFINQVDLSTIALACVTSGLHEKAHTYFKEAIRISPLTVELVFVLRGYARFLYLDGDIIKGQEFYEDALNKLETNNLDISETVRTRELCDTYIFYARSEYFLGNKERAKEIYSFAEKVLALTVHGMLISELKILLKENAFLAGEMPIK